MAPITLGNDWAIKGIKSNSQSSEVNANITLENNKTGQKMQLTVSEFKSAQLPDGTYKVQFKDKTSNKTYAVTVKIQFGDSRSFYTKNTQLAKAGINLFEFRGLTKEKKEEFIKNMCYENNEIITKDPSDGSRIVVAKNVKPEEAIFLLKDIREKIHESKTLNGIGETLAKEENKYRVNSGQEELPDGNKRVVNKMVDTNKNNIIDGGDKISINVNNTNKTGTVYKVEDNKDKTKSYYIYVNDKEQYKITGADIKRVDDSKAKDAFYAILDKNTKVLGVKANNQDETPEKFTIQRGGITVTGRVHATAEDGEFKYYRIIVGDKEQYEIKIPKNDQKLSKAVVTRYDSTIERMWVKSDILELKSDHRREHSRSRIDALMKGKDAYGIADLLQKAKIAKTAGQKDEYVKRITALLEEIASDLDYYPVLDNPKGFTTLLDAIKTQMEKTGIKREAAQAFVQALFLQKYQGLESKSVALRAGLAVIPAVSALAINKAFEAKQHNEKVDKAKAELEKYAAGKYVLNEKSPTDYLAIAKSMGKSIVNPLLYRSRDEKVDEKYKPLINGGEFHNLAKKALKDDITCSKEIAESISSVAAKHNIKFKLESYTDFKIKYTFVLHPEEGKGTRNECVIIAKDEHGQYVVIDPSTGDTFIGATEDMAMANYCKGASTEPNSVIAYKNKSGVIEKREVEYPVSDRIQDATKRGLIAASLIVTIAASGGTVAPAWAGAIATSSGIAAATIEVKQLNDKERNGKVLNDGEKLLAQADLITNIPVGKIAKLVLKGGKILKNSKFGVAAAGLGVVGKIHPDKTPAMSVLDGFKQWQTKHADAAIWRQRMELNTLLKRHEVSANDLIKHNQKLEKALNLQMLRYDDRGLREVVKDIKLNPNVIKNPNNYKVMVFTDPQGKVPDVFQLVLNNDRSTDNIMRSFLNRKYSFGGEYNASMFLQ